MEKSVVSKRFFYLEQSLKKAWKELKRLAKSLDIEDTGFHNKPFEKMEQNDES